MTNELRRDLLAFDGQQLTLLRQVASHYADDPSYCDQLIELIDDREDRVSIGSTWLIKAHLDAEGGLTEPQRRLLILKLRNAEAWGAQLHLCQIVRYLRPDLQQAKEIAAWLSPLMVHHQPFLRAWSLDALYHLSEQHSTLAAEAREAFEAALHDRAASVRARARNLRQHS